MKSHKDEAQAYRLARRLSATTGRGASTRSACRIGLGKKKVAADLTIMPLILNSEYADFAADLPGGQIRAGGRRSHKSLAHFILALNHDSQLFHHSRGWPRWPSRGKSSRSAGSAPPSRSMPTMIPSGTNWPKRPESKLDDFMTKNLGRLPVAIRVDSTNPLGLAAFLAAVRAYIEQTGPGLTRWESLKYKDQGYVRISPVKGQPGVSAGHRERCGLLHDRWRGADGHS